MVGSMTSCENVEDSNGSLDGFWHLMRVDTLATNGTSYMENQQTLFWSVQAQLLETRKIPNQRVLFRFECTGDMLHIYEPMGTVDHTDANADYPITDVRELYDYGVHSLDTRFKRIQHSRSNMILEDDVLRLYFERY